MSTVWGLVDDRAGHNGQVLGVIAKLGLPYQLKRLEYNGLGRALPPCLQGGLLIGLDRSRSAPIKSPWPKLAIGSGRRTIPVLRTIKRKSPSTITVYLMWPGSTRGIDLIAAPEHDHPPDHPKVIRTLAPLHAVTRETLDAAREAWSPQFSHLPRPWVTLCLGGDTKQGSYRLDDWRAVILAAQKLAGHGSLVITTSRRTPSEAVTLAESLITSPHLLHRWHVDKDNPYLGMLGAADSIVVTGDSLSMCTEACASGKPVYIFAPPSVIPEKHRALHQALYDRNMARPLEAAVAGHWTPATGLDEATTIATEIRRRWPHLIVS